MLLHLEDGHRHMLDGHHPPDAVAVRLVGQGGNELPAQRVRKDLLVRQDVVLPLSEFLQSQKENESDRERR